MTMRKTTSLTMLISFILFLLAAGAFYIVSSGRLGHWSEWHLWSLRDLWGGAKTQWNNLHINLGFLFLLAGFLFLFYNWKSMVALMNNKTKGLKVFTVNFKVLTAHFNIALILLVIISIGTLLTILPVSTVINSKGSIRRTSVEKYGVPPYVHAELSSLKLFAMKANLDLQTAKTLLTDAGIQGIEDRINLDDLASINKTTPKALFEIMKPAKIRSGQDAPLPDWPPAGFGYKTLAEIGANYNLNISAIIKALEEKGIKAYPAQNLIEIAADNNTNLQTLFEALNGLAVLE